MQSWPYQIAGIEALDQYSAEKDGSGRLAKEIELGGRALCLSVQASSAIGSVERQ
jgi:hypothetical protein